MREVTSETIVQRFNFRSKDKTLTMVRKSVRESRSKKREFSPIKNVEKPGQTQPKRYLKVKSFNDLQTEVIFEAANMGRGSDAIVDSEKTSTKRAAGADDLITDDISSGPKVIKLEIKEEPPEGAPVSPDHISSTQKPHQAPASTPKLSSVQVLGHDLFYKHHGSVVLFKTTSVMDLLSKSLPLMSSNQWESVVDQSGKQNTLMTEDAWKRAFISWKALCGILNGGLLDIAIRDLLRSVRSVGETLSDTQERQVQGQDSLLINNAEVKFKVRNGTVYLEVLSAFTSLERLQEALDGSWSKVDHELASHGLSQKAAFKKRGAGAATKGPSTLTRNYMTLEAYRVLSTEHKIMDRVENLVMMVTKLKEKEKSICNEIQQTVHMILRTSCIVPNDCTAMEGHKFFRNYQDMEVIDLSSSDAEEVNDVKKEVEESSSGIESEDFSPTTSRKSFSNVEYDSDGDSEVDVGEYVEICGSKVLIKTIGSKMFMEKSAILKLLDSSLINEAIDTVLDANKHSLDEAFLHDCGQKSFISSQALKICLKSEILDDFKDRSQLLREISDIERSPALNKECQILVLKTFDSIRFRIVDGAVHLDSQKLLKLAGFSSSYVYQAPSKANLLLCKILSDRGVNTQNCFSKYGKSKYAFISLPAAHTLLRTEIGPLKDASRTRRLTEEIFTALNEQGIIKSVPDDVEKGIKICEDFPPIRYRVLDSKLFLNRKACFECLGLESAVLSSKKGYSAINAILLLGGLDLSTCYIATKHQRYSYISCSALVQLLQSRDPLMVCLNNKGQFLLGLLSALQSGAVRVLGGEEGGGVFHLSEDFLPYKYQGGQIFLSRKIAYTLAGMDSQAGWSNNPDLYDDPTGVLVERGLDPDTAFLAEYGDRKCWLSMNSLFVLMGSGPGLEEGVGNCYQTVAWRDLLSAIAIQEPRLRNHLKMETFKTDLLEKVLNLYLQSLDTNTEAKLKERTIDLMDADAESGVESGAESIQNTIGSFSGVKVSIEGEEKDLTAVETASNHRNFTEPLPSITCQDDLHTDQQVPSSAPVSPDLASAEVTPSTSCLPSPTCSLPDESTWSTTIPQFSSVSPAQYSRLQSDILAAAGGVGGHIGDWEVTHSDPEVTRLSVRPGYGASRKGSFLQPDYAAILRYSLTLAPGSCILTINEHEINSSVLDIILERGEKEGTLSFLYQLISLRPCFGSFSPELVETVSKSMDKDDISELYIDSNFIGTSSSGRTYAGTVRAKDCDFIAGDRVSDCCTHCRKLDKLTINRSILTHDNEGVLQESPMKADGVVGKTGQRSVWQLATTSEDGCSFLCPQVQSFNTSLPHAFDGSAQATTIVNHRVEISNNLKVHVELSDREVSRTFSEFQKDRQLGPLLDWVAGLRLCVGYPNSQLVKQATFIIQNMDRLKPELRKLFKFLSVDANFSYSSESGGGNGSIRAGSCQVTAEPGADICQECRLLQEPVEFLTQYNQSS